MALELQLSEVQVMTSTHSGQIKIVIADIGKMKIDIMSNPTERQTISQTLPGGSWNNPLQFPSLPYVPSGIGALAGLSQPPLQNKYKAQVPPSNGGRVKQTDVLIFNKATNSKIAGVNQARNGSKSNTIIMVTMVVWSWLLPNLGENPLVLLGNIH